MEKVKVSFGMSGRTKLNFVVAIREESWSVCQGKRFAANC